MKSWCATTMWLLVGAFAWADDPVPLRRELVPADRIAAELDLQRRGPMTRLTRDEFEQRVRAATMKRVPPRLLSAHYEARRDGDNLSGIGRWVVRQTGTRPGILPLDFGIVALASARWTDGSAWVAGELNRSIEHPGLELLVEPGERTAEFTWSARSNAGRWDLRWPVCAMTVLELDLPPGIEPVADQTVRSGPLATADPQLLRWRLAAGAAPINLTIRELQLKAPTLFVQSTARFDLHPRHVDASHDVEVTAAGGRFQELILDHDAGLRLTDVRAAGLTNWSTEDAATGTRRTKLTFAAAVAATKLQCIGIMTVPSDGQWVAPTLAVGGAVSTNESMTVVAPPEVNLEQWRDGTFRRADARCTPQGVLHISLTAPQWEATGGRPGGIVRGAGQLVDYAAHLRWWVEPERMKLDALMDVVPRQQPLMNCEVFAPWGWTPEAVEPRDPSVRFTWTVHEAENGRKVIAIDMVDPLSVGATIPLLIRFSAGPPMFSQPTPFPELTISHGRATSVALEASVSPLLIARWQPNSDSLTLPLPDGPYDGPAPQALFFGMKTAPHGDVTVGPQPGRFTAESITTVRTDHLSTRCTSVVQLRPEAGALLAVTLRATGGPSDGTWHCTGGASVRSAAPLHVLTPLGLGLAACPLTAVGVVAMPQTPTWRIQFDRPISQPTSLHFAADLPNAKSVTAPIWSVDGAASQQSKYELVDPTDEFQLPGQQTHGQVTFRRRQGAGDDLWVGPLDRMTTRLVDGRWLHRFRARVRASTPMVTFTLPDSAQLLMVRIDGCWAAPEILEAGRWQVPVNVGHDQTMDMYIATPAPSWSPCHRLVAVEPTFSGSVLSNSVPYTWHVPEQFVPHPRTGAAGGLSLNTARRSPDDWDGYPTAAAAYFVSTDAEPILWVIDRPAFMQCGLVAALVISAIAALWSQGWGKRTAVASLLIAVAGSISLPPSLAMAWAGPALIPALWVGWRTLPPVGVRWQAGIAVGMIFLAGWVGHAADPAPTTVLLVPGTPETAYAPAELLNRLDALANAGGPQVAAAIVGARYVATIAEATCHIDAQWDVYVFRAGAVLELPANGVTFEDMRVADRVALPQIRGETLHVPLSGLGPTRVSARLAVSVQKNRAEKSVRFNLPACPIAHLTLRLPHDGRLTQPPTSRGAATLAGQQLQADLGAMDVLAFAWSDAVTPRPADSVKLAPTYLWDFHGPSARLLTAYDVPAGLRSIRVSVPAALAIRSARIMESARSIEWQVFDDDVELLLPTDAKATIKVEFVPRSPLASNQPLPFPSSAAATTTQVGWRGPTNQLASGPVRGVVAINDSAVQRLFPSDEPGVIRMYRPQVGQVPMIRVQPATSPTWRGTTTFDWQLYPQLARVQVEARLTAGREPSGSVEWEVPAAVQINQVDGPGVVRWSKAGDRLQVWLDRPRADVRLTWTGHVTRANEQARFDTPIIRGAGIESEREIRVTARPGWDLVPVAVQQLTAVAVAPTGRTWTYRGAKPGFRLLFQPRQVAAATEFQVQTMVNANAGQLESTTTIVAHARRGEVRNFAIRVVGDGDIRVDAPSARVIKHPLGGNEQMWIIDLPPGVGDTYRALVTCRPRSVLNSWPLPVVSIETSGVKPAALEHHLMLGSGCQLRDAVGLQKLASTNWRVVADEWRGVVAINSP